MTLAQHDFDEKRRVPSWPAIVAVFMLTALGAIGNAAIAANDTAKSKQSPGSHVEPGAKESDELDPSRFGRSENIDNVWLPLRPGTQLVYSGHTTEDGIKTPHRIVFTVTDLTKMIGGVRTRVVLDADYSDGRLIEKELTYFAQDKEGNVWHLGQYREVYDEDEFVGGRIWHVDNPKGAKAGIMMPASPRPGTPSYSEGYAPPPFNWTDRGRVYQTGKKNRVKAGSYDNVLIIEEFDAETPGAFQLKYYAPGVGNIRVGWRGKSEGGTENLELIEVIQLDEMALAQVRATAYELEQRAGMFPSQPAMEHVPLGGPEALK